MKLKVVATKQLVKLHQFSPGWKFFARLAFSVFCLSLGASLVDSPPPWDI